jgi:antitoxin component of MazEF toxin-antitoxin module
MTKKLIKHGDDLALIIDKQALESLGITEATDLDVVIVDDVLFIKPKNPNPDASKRRQAELEKTATSIMDEYESVFKRLANHGND